MRDVPAALEATWRSGQYVGDRRPMARVTVQRPSMRLVDVSFPALPADPTTTATGTAATTTNTTNTATTHTISETYADFLFGPNSTTPKELPNVESVSWQRSLDSDVGQCTITFYNLAPLPLGETPTRDLDQLGFYTYNRGDSGFASRWGQKKNEWAGLLMPDNIVRTYEGYGFDEAVGPERDPNLVLTGVWMIDEVQYTAVGTIQVTARDLGRLLLDQIVFPPITPPDFYPLKFSTTDSVSGFIPGKTYVTYITVVNGVATPQDTVAHQDDSKPAAATSGGLHMMSLRYHKSSNYHYADGDAAQPSFDYTVKTGDYLIKLADRFDVSGGWRAIYALNKARINAVADEHHMPGGGHWIFPGETLKIPGHGAGKGTDHASSSGHDGKQAFDDNLHTFWLSAPRPKGNRAQDYEWIEGKADGKTLVRLHFNAVREHHTVYVSVANSRGWIKGAGIKQKTIPYRAADKDSDNGAAIPYVTKLVLNKGTSGYWVDFDQPIPDVRYIRLTFTNLQPYASVDDGYHAGLQYLHGFTYSSEAHAKPAKPAPAVPLSPFIKGIGDDFNKARNLKSLGRASQTADLWTYKNDGAGKGAHWYRPATPTGDGAAHRKGGSEGGQHYLWAINNLQYRHQRMDGKLRAFGLNDTEEPTWALAARFRERGSEVYHIEGTLSRFGTVKINLVRNGVRTTLATKTLRTPFDVASNTWRLRLSVTDTTAQLWVVQDQITQFDTPTLEVTDERFDDENMGYHLGFSTNSHKAGWGTFNAYGNLKGGVFDSFARPAETSALNLTETGQKYAVAGPAATAVAGKKADFWRVSGQMAQRMSKTSTTYATPGRLWALANLGSITQDVSIRCYPGTDASPDTWLLALRANTARNLLYVSLTQAGVLSIHKVIGGTDTQVFTGQAVATTLSATTVLRATIVDTALTIYVNGAQVFQSDSPEDFGNPSFGSYVGFGSDKKDVTYDVFNAIVPGTTGGGSGTDADPNTTIIEESVYVPAHIEPGAGAKPGTYEDYTDIIKLLCAWAGFYWPKDSAQKLSDGTTVPYQPGREDPILGREGVGRVWGDFEQTGTAGVADLTVDLFDKKSLMDAIGYVRDIIGYIFYIDETGAAVWRAPNIYSVGNNIAAYSPNPGRTAKMVEIDEQLTLMSLTASVNSKNVRENVFVGTADGTKGSTAAGWNANPVGLRRVGGWTDSNFATAQECAVMADLITLRQLFSYRTDQVRIPGFPKIQIDDQVRIFEQATSEGYVHYVNGVSSTLSVQDGTYTYDLETHWLGEQPFSTWLFDPTKLSQATQEYLAAINQDSDGDAYFEMPRGTTLPELKQYNFVFDGDALMAGTGAGAGNNFPSQLSVLMGNADTAGIRYRNSAGVNITTPALTARAAATIDPQYDGATYDKNILFFWAGSYHLGNSVAATGDTPAITAARARVTADQKAVTTANNALLAGKAAIAAATAAKADAKEQIPGLTQDAKERDLLYQQAVQQYGPDTYLALEARYEDNLAAAALAKQKKRLADAQDVLDHTNLTTLQAALTSASSKFTQDTKDLDTMLKVTEAAEVDEQDVFTAIKAYCAARRAKGWKVIVMTIPPRRDKGWSERQYNDFEGKRVLANSLITTNWRSFADGICDVAGDQALKPGAYTNATYYQSNQIYLQRATYTIAAKMGLAAAQTIEGA